MQQTKLSSTLGSPTKAMAIKNPKLQLLVSCLLFALGFTIVFVGMGATAGAIGKWLMSYRHILERMSGAVIILLGLFVIGLVKFNALYSDRRFHIKRLGPFTAPLAGMAFAFGWTPCVGPFLGSLLALAATTGTATQGVLYLALYSIGLAVPFILSALLFTSMIGVFGWVKRNFTLLNYISGSFLILMGLLLVIGKFSFLTNSLTISLGLPDISTTAFAGGNSVGILTSFAAGLLSFLSPCVLPLVPGYLSFVSGVAVEDIMKSGSK